MSDVIERVLVIGAGFAGLSAAISIAKSGRAVTIVERSETLADGAAITLSNRGPDALAELGVYEEALETGLAGWDHSIYDRDFYDASGTPRNVPTLPAREPDGMPGYLFLYRPRLAQLLAARASALGVTSRYGLRVTGLVDHGYGVTASYGDGTSDDFDLVIGADGSHSPTRELIFPGRIEPIYSGHMSFRWVKSDVPPGPDGFFVNEASDAVFVHSLRDGMVYIAAGLDMENRVVGHDEGIQLFRSALRKFPAPRVQELLTAVEDSDDIIVRPYTFHNLPAPWHRGRILVIGDAAHTMSAHLGAGGVMALEDGVVLGQELAGDDDIDSALMRYARRRARRTFVAVDACRQMLDLQVHYQADPRDLHRVRESAFTELVQMY
nr:FAD-dependent oxidoreductase [Microbacterium bovistercoris]